MFPVIYIKRTVGLKRLAFIKIKEIIIKGLIYAFGLCVTNYSKD